MGFINLTEKNTLLYAARNYTNINCSGTAEFYDDYKRLIYLKRIFIKYQKTNEIKEKLVYNHLVVLYNVFNELPITRILFVKLPDHLHILKPFLILMDKMPNVVPNINNQDIHTADIPMDINIIRILRQMKHESKNR